jgi:hypothetical protein
MPTPELPSVADGELFGRGDSWFIAALDWVDIGMATNFTSGNSQFRNSEIDFMSSVLSCVSERAIFSTHPEETSSAKRMIFELAFTVCWLVYGFSPPPVLMHIVLL